MFLGPGLIVLFGWNKIPGLRSIQKKWVKWPVRILTPFLLSNAVSSGVSMVLTNPLPTVHRKYKEGYKEFLCSGDIRSLDPHIELVE